MCSVTRGFKPLSTHFSQRMLGVVARKSFSPHLFRSFTTRVRPVPVLCDSVSGKKKEIIQSGDYLSWYSCGPTVYDSSHVGHARTYVQIDVIQRILDKRFGYNVYNALGITNIDDKIINKSKETHIPWKEIADKYESEYFSDMSKLNVQMPKSIIRVSDTIPEIIEYIRVLLDKRIAYTTKNGVYFDTQSELYSYSKLVPPSDDTATQSRISSDDEKRHLRDFALWKFTDEEVRFITSFYYRITIGNLPGEMVDQDGILSVQVTVIFCLVII